MTTSGACQSDAQSQLPRRIRASDFGTSIPFVKLGASATTTMNATANAAVSQQGM